MENHRKHKAKVFISTLGIGSSDAPFLQQALLEAAKISEATEGTKDEYGQRYSVDFPMQTTKGKSLSTRQKIDTKE